MAARIDPQHDSFTRQKIKTSQLVNRLQDNALGNLDKEMTAGQVRSALGVLAKTLPDLKAIEHKGDPDRPIVHKVTREIVRPQNTDG